MDTEVTAIIQIFHTYRVATVVAMNALTGMKTMEICSVTATGETYRYSGSAWELIISSLVGIVWKDTQPVIFSSTASTGVGFTDLDITADTSAAAKIAIIQVMMHIAAYTSGGIIFYLRKNGTTPVYPIRVQFPAPANGSYFFAVVMVGLDANQVLEYAFTIDAATVDMGLYLLGYIE